MKRILLVVGILVLVGIGVLVYNIFSRQLIPVAISRQLRFGVFYPQGDSSIAIQRSTFKYDGSIGQLSFVITYNGEKLTFGEQATPQDFYSSSNYYNNLVTKLGGYYTFQNSQGTVNLATDPSVGHEVGIMNAKGTLIFVSSSGQLGDNDWREVFNSLVYAQGK